jgi:hypothetical protein
LTINVYCKVKKSNWIFFGSEWIFFFKSWIRFSKGFFIFLEKKNIFFLKIKNEKNENEKMSKNDAL